MGSDLWEWVDGAQLAEWPRSLRRRPIQNDSPAATVAHKRRPYTCDPGDKNLTLNSFRRHVENLGTTYVGIRYKIGNQLQEERGLADSCCHNPLIVRDITF